MTLSGKQFRNLIIQNARNSLEIEPRCPHARACGGCAFQERSYDGQIAAKAAVLNQLWDESDLPSTIRKPTPVIEIVPSPDPYAYRTRMDYVATKGRFGLRMRGRFNYIVELETCHLIPPTAFAAAYAVWLRARELGVPDYNVRSHEGFLRYLVVRRSPQDTLLLAAVTAAGEYGAEMEQLAALALQQPGVIGFHWLRNDSLTDISFGTPVRHWGAGNLPMRVGANTLHVGPNSFFQNNVHLLIPLLDAAAGCVGKGERVIDLYGGVGTVALHIAPHVESVICVESQAESAGLARYNSALNGATNVRVLAEEVWSFLRRQMPGRFDTIIADPPRTGLGPEVCAELVRLAPRRVVYVSCNPLTQIADLRLLAPSYRLVALTGYDMFPHTPHIETLAVLDRII